jgi:hypothetical protein
MDPMAGRPKQADFQIMVRMVEESRTLPIDGITGEAPLTDIKAKVASKLLAEEYTVSAGQIGLWLPTGPELEDTVNGKVVTATGLGLTAGGNLKWRTRRSRAA